MKLEPLRPYLIASLAIIGIVALIIQNQTLGFVALTLSLLFLAVLNIKHHRARSSIDLERQTKKDPFSSIELVANLPLAVFVCDRQSKIHYYNKAAQALVNLDTPLIGKQLLSVLHWPALHDILQAVMSTGQSCTETISIFNESPLHYSIQCNNINPGDSAYFAIQITDVTSLTNLSRVRKDFVENVSHELKTPLTAIMGFSEILVSDETLATNPSSKSALDIIMRNAIRMNLIVKDLLLLAEAEEGLTELDLQATNLSELVESIIANKKAAIEASLDPGLPQLLGSRNLLIHAVENLIDNAIKHNKPGTPIFVETRLERDHILFSVRDQGAGIPKRDQEKLFERFYRVDKARSRETGGTGLGLSIVKHIIVAHGGKIGLESTLGEGSCFYFTLPLNKKLIP